MPHRFLRRLCRLSGNGGKRGGLNRLSCFCLAMEYGLPMLGEGSFQRRAPDGRQRDNR
jgi:hypothetical protein